MDFSPTRQSKVAACEKLRDIVHSISAMHSSISEGARNTNQEELLPELLPDDFLRLWLRKDELVSELKPPSPM
ncbi:hypothetical protein TNCV_7861 [Trichonephila clavipes]|nr:hypothetical protein TNCV_7861 [Trichonephila clavipes]